MPYHLEMFVEKTVTEERWKRVQVLFASPEYFQNPDAYKYVAARESVASSWRVVDDTGEELYRASGWVTPRDYIRLGTNIAYQMELIRRGEDTDSQVIALGKFAEACEAWLEVWRSGALEETYRSQQFPRVSYAIVRD